MVRQVDCKSWIYYISIKRHMAKIGKEKLQVLIGEMSHYDPDNMEMAAKQLSEIILAGELNLETDEKIATQVREAYMKQIESDNDTVQSEAIKYLADIVPKLPSAQVELIFEKILEYIVNLNLHEKKRERYGACAATVIHQAAEEHGHKLENLFLKSIARLLEFKDRKSEIQIILIGIITQFLKKWPNVASHLKFDRPSLTIYLLKNVQVKSKLDIIKKSETCLGKLALILGKENIQMLVTDKDWGLLRFIESSRKRQGLENLKHLRNGLLCLNQVIRTNNVELRWWVREAGQLLVGTIEQFRGWDDIELIEPVCDILDAALTALAYLIKTFSRELKDLLLPRENPFNAFILPLLAFDVEGMMSYAGEPMAVEEAGDDEQEYYEQAQVDEKCWKVRRATLNYVGVLAKYDHNLLERIGEGELVEQLGDKLVEEHAMVSEMAFATFNTLVELISIDRGLVAEAQEQEISLQRVKSSALNVAQNLIKQVTRRISIVFNNTKFNDQLKIESSKILLRIIQIYNHILINNEQEAFSLINFVLDQLKKTAIVENKCNLLACLRELVSNDYPFAHYQRLWDYVFETIARTSTVKVQTIAFAILRRINQTFKAAVPADSKYYASLLGLLRGKIKEFDGDKSIKVAVMKCLGSVFAGLPVGEADAVYFLENLSAKLKIEVEKLPIVQTLLRLQAGVVCSPEKAKVLETITKQVADNLGSNNYQLNVKSIEAINQALAIVGGKFSQGTLSELLEKSKHLLNNGKIPLFFRPIADSNPKMLKPYSELIIRSTETYYIAKLISAGVVEKSAVVKILKGLDIVEKGKKISLTLGSIGITAWDLLKEADDTNWGRVIIGAVGYVGDESALGPLFKLLETLKVEENRYAVCAAIGNVVSRDQDKLVGKLMEAASAVKDVYLYICIFKEMIGYNSQPFAQLPQLIEWLLVKSEDKFEAESNYFITSECVGKLAFISPEAAKLVVNNAKSANQNRRLIVANSLRFGLEAQTSQDSHFLREYIQVIVTLVGDGKVRVREGAVKSLIAVAQLHPKTLKDYSSNRDFWKAVVFNSHINDDLISNIDYGLCKEVRDEGKSLRLESFNLLQILVTKLTLEGPQIDEIMGATLHRIAGESSNDIVLKRLTVLRSLCQLDYTPFLRIQEEFVRAVGTKEGVFKKYQTKAPEDERTEVFVRGLLQEINTLHQLLKQENIDRLAPLFVQYRSNPALAAILDAISKSN